jgi:hypothetical protein
MVVVKKNLDVNNLYVFKVIMMTDIEVVLSSISKKRSVPYVKGLFNTINQV